MSDEIVTRFAPSPTGFLHIGGARTALFNWLYARGRGGRFLLRIEDTDRERSTTQAIQAIIDGLTWLELDWDGDPVFQSARIERHREVVEQLLAQGHAYRCYATPEELATMRERARKAGRAALYDGTWRDRDPSEAPKGAPYTIRFRSPQTGETVIEDRVQGRVVFNNADLDDLVILRSDGTPTYNLSVVVDDLDMGITHVIRGVDHLTNAARQAQIYAALGRPLPVFAHVPLIHGPDGAKLSKRHGALGVEAYRAMGYLPVALRNYLARLGWSHGDAEIISTEELLAWFDLDAIGRSPARFDFAKLASLNGHYIRSTPDGELVARIKAVLPDLPGGRELAGQLNDLHWQRLERAMPGLKPRAKTLVDLLEGAGFLFAKRPLALDDKAAALLDEEGRRLLGEVLPALEQVEDWTPARLEAAVRACADRLDVKLGKLAQPLRAALTGRGVSPGIFEVLEVLGREESLARIRDQLPHRDRRAAAGRASA